MDKNSLIQDIKNDLNTIKKQVEVALAKLAVLESMIELDKKLGGSVAEPVEAPVEELGVEEPAPVAVPIEESRDNACIVREPEQALESEIELEEEIIPHSSFLIPNSEVAEPLRNLMSIIGLNDRFRFRHDLFSDSNDLFKETIEILNTIENFEKAVDYLQGKFNWNEEDATVVYFYDIIKPKF